jgi:hypothetical protein
MGQVAISEGKTEFRRSTSRLEDNIKINPPGIDYDFVDWTEGHGRMIGSCKHSIEHLRYITDGEFEKLRDYQLLKDSAHGLTASKGMMQQGTETRGVSVLLNTL